MIWLLWKHFFSSWADFFYVKEAKKSYLLSDRMLVMSDILSDSNIKFSDSIFVILDILSGA